MELKLMTKLVLLVLALAGQFPAKLGPRTRSNKSQARNFKNKPIDRFEGSFVTISLVPFETIKCKMAVEVTAHMP